MTTRNLDPLRTSMNNDPFSLSGRVALVTGSSKVLGRAMAMALGAAGAKVAINYFHDPDPAHRAFHEYKNHGYEGMLVRASVIEADDVNGMILEIADELGPVDILVVNATPDQPQKPIEEYNWDFYQSMLDFFIKSPFLLPDFAAN
ncbi:SDR family NAD(P)-dependent oxidoreductase [Acidobacteria bacterium AH-259-O06]|nr:SDR family NAD(P)-dependent oxidoreductase [Acidobacteria bacterium AH-259-O06]